MSEPTIWDPKSLDDVRASLALYKATGCGCDTDQHLNLLHDFAETDVPWLIARVAELEAREQRVRKEHRPSSPGIDGWTTEWCPCCDVEYPCQTVRTLDGTQP